MHMNFSLDIAAVGVSKVFRYENNFHINSEYIQHTTNDERKRRVKLFIEATRMMNDYANQARNAISGEPQQVLIVFDSKMSRKASRFFVADEIEKANILAELKERNGENSYFYGNDVIGNSEPKEGGVGNVTWAYSKALDYLSNNALYNPCPPDTTAQTFAETFPA